ncbi:MAG: 30S ribosome-binding factor RbfA [Phototrophicaceae bacterium]|jgi:ribosome-binding factor A
MGFKQARVAERIRVIVSELLTREVSDPRLQGVTVTEVTVDNELTFARIFVNALGDEDREKEIIEAFKRAQGYFRREVAQRLQLRSAPEIRFVWDKTLARSEKVHNLIKSLDIPKAPPPVADPLAGMFADEDYAEDYQDDEDNHEPADDESDDE